MDRKASRAATKLAIRHYLSEVWRQKKYSIPAMVLVSIGTIFSTYIPPLVVAAMINRFNNQPPALDDLWPYLALFAGAWFVGELLWRTAFLCLNRANTRGVKNLYIAGLDQIREKDIGFFHDNFAGSLTKKVIGYGRNFEMFTDTLVINIAKNVLPLIFVCVVLWQFSPLIVATLLGLMAVVVMILVPLIRRRRKLIDLREAASNHMAGHIADVISNMDTVQAFAHEEEEQSRHRQNAIDHERKTLRSWDYHTLRIDLSISPIYVLVNVIGLALAITLSGDTVTMATIFITFNYFAFITQMLWEFNRTYRNLENAIADVAQFTELLLTPPAINDPPRPQSFKVTKGAITFRDVHFAYNGGGNAPLFAGLNLNIAPSEKIALVGHSGGGKTTITKLLLRFVDIASGELLIDGHNIALVRLKDVRQAIAYVPQEPVMFHRSIMENIRYGQLNASDAAVVSAAKQANAHEFISQLPEGYHTMVGERGIKLSGGQRQRVAIARAIIKDAPILVLDEATSALDSGSEKLIQAALWKLMESRTAVVIAHRLSTIQRMDRIIVLDAGQIVEEGTHQELLTRHGIYATLWAHQSGGFLEG